MTGSINQLTQWNTTNSITETTKKLMCGNFHSFNIQSFDFSVSLVFLASLGESSRKTVIISYKREQLLLNHITD